MKFQISLLSLAVSSALLLSACQNDSNAKAVDAKAATAADAQAFIKQVNQDLRDNYPEEAAAQWVASTYINGDTQLLAAKANERSLARLKENTETAATFSGVEGIDPATGRALKLLERSTSMPAPR